MADVVMPRLSDSMEEGTILQWMKQVGDEVAVGEELVEIETDKANMAYESDLAGTLTEILVEEGGTVAIGDPIARVGDSDEGSSRPACGSCRREMAPRPRGTTLRARSHHSTPPAGGGRGNSTRAPNRTGEQPQPRRRPPAKKLGAGPKRRRLPAGWRKSGELSWGRSWAPGPVAES